MYAACPLQGQQISVCRNLSSRAWQAEMLPQAWIRRPTGMPQTLNLQRNRPVHQAALQWP